MSKETMQWLNLMTLRGMTDELGEAWHYMECWQGEESNHYPGPIPIADVVRRLFNWEPIKAQNAALVPAPAIIDANGLAIPDLSEVNCFDRNGNPFMDKSGRVVIVVPSQSDRVSIVRSDNYLDLGVFKSGYEPHDYKEWLLQVFSNILGDTLVVSSAGLLRLGAQAWVEASFPKTMHDEETGFDYRPFLLATTSLDGSLQTGYFAATNATVCDNTMYMAMGSAGTRQVKYKHSKYSGLKIEDARKSLGILHNQQETFEAELHKWARIDVPDTKWVEVMEILIPTPDEKEQPKAFTRALNKREELNHVYHNDSMANTWKGTALGVIQAVNTFAHHYGEVRGKQEGVSDQILRAQRNNEKKVKGEFADLDSATIDALVKVMDLDKELVAVN